MTIPRSSCGTVVCWTITRALYINGWACPLLPPNPIAVPCSRQPPPISRLVHRGDTRGPRTAPSCVRSWRSTRRGQIVRLIAANRTRRVQKSYPGAQRTTRRRDPHRVTVSRFCRRVDRSASARTGQTHAGALLVACASRRAVAVCARRDRPISLRRALSNNICACTLNCESFYAYLALTGARG